MAIQPNGAAPYAPPKTVIDVITRYRERGLSTPFDHDVLARAGVAESLVPRVLQTLRLLDLVDDDGNPTEQLEDTARVPGGEYQTRFQEVIRSAYSDVFAFADPTKDEPARIRDAFRSYNPRGQQERMVTLFLGLCQFAGIIEAVPKRIPTPRASSSLGDSASKRGKSKRAAVRRRSKAGASSQLDDGDVQPSRLPLLASLLGELPEPGTVLSAMDRERFMHMFATVLDFYFPSSPVVNSEDAEGESVEE